MIRVLALYPNTPGSSFNRDYYLTRHCPMALQKLTAAGLTSMEVDLAAAGDAPFHAVALLSFPSPEVFQAALESVGGELIADVPNYTDAALQLQVGARTGF